MTLMHRALTSPVVARTAKIAASSLSPSIDGLTPGLAMIITRDTLGKLRQRHFSQININIVYKNKYVYVTQPSLWLD